MGLVSTFHFHFIHFILVNFHNNLILLRKLKKYLYKRTLGGEGQNFWNSVKLGKTFPKQAMLKLDTFVKTTVSGLEINRSHTTD